MGYMVRAIEGVITIPEPKVVPAGAAVLTALKAAGGYWYDNAQNVFAAEGDDDINGVTLAQLLRDVGFDVDPEPGVGLNIIWYDGKSTDDLDAVGKALAGFAEAGSYLVWLGEQAEQWRWYYTATKFYEQVPTITWPPVDNEAEEAN